MATPMLPQDDEASFTKPDKFIPAQLIISKKPLASGSSKKPVRSVYDESDFELDSDYYPNAQGRDTPDSEFFATAKGRYSPEFELNSEYYAPAREETTPPQQQKRQQQQQLLQKKEDDTASLETDPSMVDTIYGDTSVGFTTDAGGFTTDAGSVGLTTDAESVFGFTDAESAVGFTTDAETACASETDLENSTVATPYGKRIKKRKRKVKGKTNRKVTELLDLACEAGQITEELVCDSVCGAWDSCAKIYEDVRIALTSDDGDHSHRNRNRR